MSQPLKGGNGAAGPPSAGNTEAIAILADIAEAGEVDLLTFLEDSLAAMPADGTREGALVPGVGETRGLGLSEEDEKALAGELDDVCSRYFQAMEPANEQEQEIRDAYTMAATGSSASGISKDQELVSESLMVRVDQIAARLTTNLTSVAPFVKVDPVHGSAFDDPGLVDDARATEAFLCEYVPNDMDFRHLLPQAILRATKVGTAVFRIAWHEEEHTTSFYPKGGNRTSTQTETIGGVRAQLVENRHVIIWPPTCINWQRDYEVVGHRAYHARSSWKQLAKQWNLSDEVIAAVEGYPGEKDEGAARERERVGIDSQQLDGSKTFDPQVELTELWCNLWLGAPHNKRVKFQVIMHRPTRRILWSGLNPHFTGKHPYFPLRYKWRDLSAWGAGVGHEVLNGWAADTALWNLTIRNIEAGSFYIVVRDGNAVHHTSDQPIRPGMEVVSDAPATDYQPRKMGGDAQEVPATRQENDTRMDKASGLPAVAMGMGDPIMKSGAGTGSTMALIEQASMKIRMTDLTLREDFTPICEFTLELVAQYGNEGVFYNHVGEADGMRLQRLAYVPPRGRDISSMFRIRAMAPSAGTSTEGRRNNYMLVWSFAQQAVMTMGQIVGPLLQQHNPAGLARWQWSMGQVLTEITRRVLETHEVPGVVGMLPDLPEQTPEDQQINELQAQLAQANAMIEQLYAQAQGALGGGQPGAAGGMGGGMPMPMMQPGSEQGGIAGMAGMNGGGGGAPAEEPYAA